MNHYSVIIIGAGPAGSTCAYQLAKKNVKTLMLDQARMPRFKSCGGGLSQKTVDFYDFDLSPILEVEVKKTTIALWKNKTISLERPEGMGYMVMRDQFDALIAEKAEAAGAVFHQQEKLLSLEPEKNRWIVRTDKDAYSADFLVGADGAPSKTARLLGLMKGFDRYGAAISAELRVSDRQLERQGPCVHFDFQLIDKGYAWIFPKSGNLSVGVFTTFSKSKGLRARLDEFIAHNENLRGYQEMFFSRAGLIPRGGVYNRLVTEGALLAGDAAAMCDPFFGEGLYYAAQTGDMAAQAILRAMQEGRRGLEHYDQACRRELTRDLWWARFFNFTCYRFPKIVHPIISRRPYLQDLVLEVNRGGISWQSCVLRMIFLSPYWAFQGGGGREQSSGLP